MKISENHKHLQDQVSKDISEIKQILKWEPYLERLSSVSISVMVEYNIISHVKAFTYTKVVEQWWLLGNITHVHNCNIWNERERGNSAKKKKKIILNPILFLHGI